MDSLAEQVARWNEFINDGNYLVTYKFFDGKTYPITKPLKQWDGQAGIESKTETGGIITSPVDFSLLILYELRKVDINTGLVIRE